MIRLKEKNDTKSMYNLILNSIVQSLLRKIEYQFYTLLISYIDPENIENLNRTLGTTKKLLRRKKNNRIISCRLH